LLGALEFDAFIAIDRAVRAIAIHALARRADADVGVLVPAKVISAKPLGFELFG
jgi:hypothetical protein